MKIGVCKLCRQQRKLRKQSHIFPEHVYKFLKDSACKNKMAYVETQRSYEGPQTGEFEKYLLCEKCETLISKFEEYGSNIFYQPQKIPNLNNKRIKNIEGVELLIWNGVGYDYKKYKLYILSMLWRASISSRHFFKGVSLDSDTEGDLRKKILNENPGEVFEYPISIISPAIFEDKRLGLEGFAFEDVLLIGAPFMYQFEGVTVCFFIILGHEFRIFLTTELNKDIIKSSSVKKDKLVIPLLTKDQTIERRNNIFNSLDKKSDKM